MKKIVLNNIEENEVFSVLIKWKGCFFYTGYYYDKNGNDSLFNNLKNIECFKTPDELFDFCVHNNLLLNNDLTEFDFDIIPTNPIDYHDILNKWNLLDTISSNLNIRFEGKEKKYDSVYNYLFSCNFAVTPLPTLFKIPNDYFQLINDVFNTQSEVLKKIKYLNVNE